MRSFAVWITRHRKVVIGAWIVTMIAVTALTQSVGSDFNEDFKPAKSDSQQAYDMLRQNNPKQSGDTGQVVFRAERGLKDAQTERQIEDTLTKIAKVESIASVISPYSPEGAQQVSADGKTAFATVNWKDFVTQGSAKSLVDPVIEIIEEARTSDLRIEGGGSPFQQAQQTESGGAEVVGVGVAMLVLFVMFGTFLAMGMPIVTAMLAVGTSISLIALLTHVIDTADFATVLASMIGLGVGIDYALFVVTRFRQNMRHGVEPTESVVLAMDTAGRAVLFAGVTVMIALLGLLIVGIAFLNGPAIAASMTVLLTMIASLTLLPALLTIAGPRINQPFFVTLGGAIARNWMKFREGQVVSGIVSSPLLLLQIVLFPVAYAFYGLVIWLPQSLLRVLRLPVPHRSHAQIDEGENAHPRWHKWSSWVQRRPWPVAIVTASLLIALSIPAFSMNLGIADAGTDSKEMTTRQAYDLLAQGFGPGFNAPLLIVVESSAGKQRVAAVEKSIKADADVAGLVPATPSPNGKILVTTVFPKSSPQSTKTSELLERIRDSLAPLNADGHKAHVAGVVAIFDDFSALIASKLPLFMGTVILLSALLLMAVFRSISIAIKAVAMNMLGILAAFGVTVAIFQWGWMAELFGIESTAPIIAFLPVMMFAIVFGLSMDYEVFLMSRVHEEWERTKDAEAAVVEGLSATGGVITAAAVIMISLFASFAFLSNDLTTKLFGVSLATTIFLDAFVIRSALVPAVMAILGKRAWYMPAWLDRVLPRVSVESSGGGSGSGSGSGQDSGE